MYLTKLKNRYLYEGSQSIRKSKIEEEEIDETTLSGTFK